MVMHEEEDSSSNEYIDYKAQFKELKKKHYCLLTENEAFSTTLRQTQRKLLKASRDKAFLCERLLEYEKPVFSSDSSDAEDTESSDEEQKTKSKKRASSSTSSSANKPPKTPKKKSAASEKNSQLSSPVQKIKVEESTEIRSPSTVYPPVSRPNVQKQSSSSDPPVSSPGSRPIVQRQSSLDGHMTPEEVERHLESTRQRQSATTRPEMFLKSALDTGTGEVFGEVNSSTFMEHSVEDMLPSSRTL